MSRNRLAVLSREELAREVPEQDYDFAQPIQMSFNEMLEGSRADLAVRIFGDDYVTMEKIGEQVKSILEGLPCTSNAEFETQGRVPVLEIRADRAALLKFNVEASKVNSAITTAMAGHTVGTFIGHNCRRIIVVRLPENLRNNLEMMKASPCGLECGPCQRLSLQSLRQCSACENRGEYSDARRLSHRIRWSVRAFAGISRSAHNRGASGSGADFVLIHAMFKSVTQSLIIYTGIPCAITGGVLALWLRGLPFSISAAIGFIALCGVAVLNGEVLISHFNQ